MFERVAGEMACVHNMIVRGLNSIYLQAPHIPLPEVPAFIQYSLIWYKLMHLHHSCEESDFFQTISGETGIMSGNVEQHHAFQEELVTFYLYLKECANDPTQFSGNRILSSIDSFGRVWCNTLPRRFQRSLVYKGLASRRWGNWRPDFLKTARRTWKKWALWPDYPGASQTMTLLSKKEIGQSGLLRQELSSSSVEVSTSGCTETGGSLPHAIGMGDRGHYGLCPGPSLLDRMYHGEGRFAVLFVSFFCFGEHVTLQAAYGSFLKNCGFNWFL